MSVEISIRSIQHYMYCPHRWGLIEIDKSWAENYFVTRANIMHQRVHAPYGMHSNKKGESYNSVPVYNDLEEYNLYGVVDVLEIAENRNVAYNIVEYKPSMPKSLTYSIEDAMQVFAQKMCVDYIFNCNCSGSIFYSDTKKRIELPLTEQYDTFNNELLRLLGEMRYYIDEGQIPKKEKGQKCGGCSLKDICIPTIKKQCNFDTLLDEAMCEEC